MELEAPRDDGAPIVVSVLAGSMAERAGVRPGDRWAGLDGQEVTSIEAVHSVARRCASRREATIVLLRAGERIERGVEVRPLPAEEVPGCEVVYGDVEARGARLRTIVTRPERCPPGGCAAILLVPGISCDSIDYWHDGSAPACRLVRGWAEAGLVTMRVEKRGVGDSEGGPCAQADFEAEVAGYRAGLRALFADPAVGAGSVFLFGHSVGGMIAPLIARDGATGGIIVFGTSPWRWSTCMLASLRRQMHLRGRTAAEIASRMALQEELYRALFTENVEPAQALARNPALRACGDQTFGRTPRYLRQLDACDLMGAWSRVACPTLAIHGEHDWVVSEEEHRALVGRIHASGGRADLVRLRGVDHLMTEQPTVEASLARYGEGPFCRALVDLGLAFVRRAAG